MPDPSELRLGAFKTPHGAQASLFVLTTGPATVREDAIRDDSILETSWTVQSDAKRGDLVAVYVTSPLTELFWFGRLCSDAARVRLGRSQFTASVQLVALDNPIGLRDLRAHGVIGNWPALKGRLQGKSRRVAPQEVADALLQLLAERNPRLGVCLENWQGEVAPELTPERFEWEGGPDRNDPFSDEQSLQQWLRHLLIEAESFRDPTAADGLALPSLEARMGAKNRADILLVGEHVAPPELLLIETKLFAGDRDGAAALGQIRRYREWLAVNRPGWRVRAAIAAQHISPATRDAAVVDGVECWLVSWTDPTNSLATGDAARSYRLLGEDESGPTATLDPTGSANALALLTSPEHRSLWASVDLDAAPTTAGCFAIWLRANDSVAITDLGLQAKPESDQLLYVGIAPNLRKGVQGGPAMEAFLSMLDFQILLTLDGVPFLHTEESVIWPFVLNEVDDWCANHIHVSFVGTLTLVDAGVVRALGVRDLDPVFNGLADLDDLGGSFPGFSTSGDEAMRRGLRCLAWQSFVASEVFGNHLRERAGDELWVALDSDGLFAFVDPGDTSENGSVLIPKEFLQDTTRELLRRPPVRWYSKERASNSPAWSEVVKAMKPSDQLRVLFGLWAMEGGAEPPTGAD